MLLVGRASTALTDWIPLGPALPGNDSVPQRLIDDQTVVFGYGGPQYYWHAGVAQLVPSDGSLIPVVQRDFSSAPEVWTNGVPHVLHAPGSLTWTLQVIDLSDDGSVA